MTSIFSKIRVLTAAMAHDILDKAVDINSVPVLKQYLRELEEARAGLEATLAEARYDLRKLQDQATTLGAQITQEESQARAVAATNREAALALASRVSQKKNQLAALSPKTAAQQTAVTNLERAVTAVRTKEHDMHLQLSSLEAQAATAAASNKAAAAVEAAGVAVGAAESVDGLADRIGRQSAVASARLERAVGELGGDPSEAGAASAVAEAELNRILGQPQA